MAGMAGLTNSIRRLFAMLPDPRSLRAPALARFSLRDYLDRKVCTMILTAHERDWFTWHAMGVSRCRHCRSPMPDPFTETA